MKQIKIYLILGLLYIYILLLRLLLKVSYERFIIYTVNPRR